MSSPELHVPQIDSATVKNLYLALAAATFNLGTRDEAEDMLAKTGVDPAAELARKIPGFDTISGEINKKG